MSVIQNNTTYYIQHVDTNEYVSLPKKYPACSPCVTTSKDENKYYQRWRVRFDSEQKDFVPKFERPYFITEATEGKVGLGLSYSPNNHVSVTGKDAEDASSWMVQDTVAKMKAAKRKAASKKAAETKDADKEDTSDKDGASDLEASEGEAAEEDTSDKDGASDPEASKDEAAKVTAYT
ncbi:hypothetical protein CY34DRAFT_540015 [Suillus luteus UH-Slu-Lm8-n1]|uniref:Uncharacterized protein n=1 Tax=Suillus luteus UH-Slu-Lm8-n1 TaxID=930992 RepID=A0A0D0BQE7_9AGAM|nr:hypothetical protein CY34DRAFT_540015 [Suillus luteus UH-Slu-Lm8-n1]